jgi:E3 ubiquitin-protein ligase HERC3
MRTRGTLTLLALVVAATVASCGEESQVAPTGSPDAGAAPAPEPLPEASAPPGRDATVDAAPAPPPPKAIQVVARGLHTCVLFGDGRIKCWGYGPQGELGVAGVRRDQPSELPVVELGPGVQARHIEGGHYHTCAIVTGGAVKCWGLNSGALGLGDTSNRGNNPGQMGTNLPTVDLGAGRTALGVTAGGAAAHLTYTCVRLDDGRVKCWGKNEFGQLGLGDTLVRGDEPGEMGDRLPFVDLGPGRTSVQIVAGGAHTCARLDNGTLKCWGHNYSGELGLGDTRDRGDEPGEMGDALPPVDLGPGRTAVQVSAGRAHTCAVLDDGSLKCWGSNSYGALGLGDTDNRGDGPGEMGSSLPPVTLGAGRKAVRVECGDSQTCAILDDGTLRCWGNNAYGGLGVGDTLPRGDKASDVGVLPVVNLGTARRVVDLALGHWHSCAVLDDGTVKCWGWNGGGQLGLGDKDNRGDGPGEMGDALPLVQLW